MAFKFYNQNPKQKFTDDCVIRAISNIFTGGNMYEDHENLNYLAHHGILGMKWGKQNGPPYPLSDAKHDRVVQRAEKKRIRREKRAADKKANILSDPKKIVKYQSKLTKREIDSALKKFDSVDKVRERITESTLKKHIKKVRLSNKKKDGQRHQKNCKQMPINLHPKNSTKLLNIYRIPKRYLMLDWKGLRDLAK